MERGPILLRWGL